MANPDPEIAYPDAVDARKDVIMATGRSDYPNQVNNVLGFPFIFRGALDVAATAINEEMKIAAVNALASLAKENVPESVARAYGVDHFQFGREYLIPKPFDPRILMWESAAVAQAAIETGVAQHPVDIDEYKQQLAERIGQGRKIMTFISEKARRNPKKIVFPEGDSQRILHAARIVKDEGIATPIVLGSHDDINAVAAEHEIDLSGIEIIDPITSEKRISYAQKYFKRRCRAGITEDRATWLMRDRTYFGLMMLETGDCDAVLSGVLSDYPATVRPALEIIDLAPGATRVSGLFAMLQKDKVYMFADTTVNINPTAEELAEIALLSADVARRFGIAPKIAMLSFSNFGSARYPESQKVARATALLKEKAPDLVVEGEIQADLAADARPDEAALPVLEAAGTGQCLYFPGPEFGKYRLQAGPADGWARCDRTDPDGSVQAGSCPASYA